MRQIIFIITTFICYLLFSCSNYKYVFLHTNDKIASDLSEAHSKYLNKDELYLSFIGVYNQSKLKIYVNDSILFDDNLPIDKKDITKSFKVSSNKKLTIYFEDIRKPLIITNEQMKNYKFIYIEKHRKKVIIEFNNGTKNFNRNIYLDN